jgi:uncharacterized membrane protein
MEKKENVSISIKSSIKNNIDAILEGRKNRDGENISRSQYIENMIEESVKKDIAIQEHIDKNNEILEMEEKLRNKKKEVREDAERLIEKKYLKKAIARP